jgi:hypothetical protein
MAGYPGVHRAARQTRRAARPLRLVLVVAAALAGVLALSQVAVAYFSATGNGTGSVMTGTLAAPTAVAGSQTAGTGTVTVSWNASAGTPAPTGYYVRRLPASGPPQAGCGTSAASTTSATTCSDTGVPLGTYTYEVVAVFRTWTATSAPSTAVTVAQATQSITFTSSPVSPAFGGTYTVSATGGGSGNPVVFSSGTPAVCTVSGATVTFVHAGTCTVNADQAGSTYYAAAPQNQQTFGVAKSAQTVVFTSTAPTAAVIGGAGYTPTATGGGSGNPVTFTIDATTAANCSINAGLVTYEHAGSCTIDANQAGNGDYLAANQVQQSYVVSKGAQAISFTSIAPSNAKVGGSSYTVSAVGGASGNAVTFSTATPGVCTVSGSTVTFVGAGTCTVNADQAGNADYLAASQVQQSFAVSKNDQTITFTSTAPGSATVGGTYAVSATASSGLTVAFTSATPAVCTVTGSTVSFVGVGTCTINANQAGNGTWNPAPQVQQSFTVVSAADTTDPVISAIEPGNEGPASWNSIACSTGSNTGRICVTASDNVGVTSVRIKLTKANGRCWSGTGSSSFDTANCSTLVSLTQSGAVWVSNQLVRQTGSGQPNFTNDSYTLEVTVSDAAGNTTTATRAFSING